jgi:type II secretory pathway component GspD/PulD (secretin)
MAEIDRTGLTTGAATVTCYYRLKHRSSQDANFAATVLQYMATTTTARADADTNAFMLYDVKSSIDSAVKAVAWLDVPTPQVRVDCTIYEADIQDDGTIGLDYMSWKNGPGRSAFAVGAFSERASLHLTASDVPVGAKGPSALFNTGVPTNTLPGHHFSNHGSNYAKLCDVSSAYFDYLGDKGKALVKNRSSLTVLHNNTATFQTSDSILYYAVGDATPGTLTLGTGPKDLSVNANAIAADPKGAYRDGVLIDPAPSTGNSTKVGAENRTVVGAVATRSYLGGSQLTATDTGVWVKVTPTIGTDDIRLAVETSVINHVGYADNGRPIVAKRASTAEVTVPEGKEIVLSGMVHETEVHENRKVPILGSLPFIGYLFGNEIKQMNRRLVVVVLKATRVEDYKGMTPEDENVVERAKGNLPIKMPGVRFELRGDSFPR